MDSAWGNDIYNHNWADISANLPTTDIDAGTSVEAGLRRRRQAEQNLFDTATSVMSGC